MRLFVLFLLLTVSIYSQSNGSITVKVIDVTSGEYLQGAAVNFEGTPFYGITDKNGITGISNIPVGNYVVKCSYLGYAGSRKEVSVGSGSQSNLLFELNPEAVTSPDVLVTATRHDEKNTPKTFSNITSEEIERISLTKDVPYILQTLPSTSYYSENGNGIGYSYIRIRGFDQRRISVFINGVPQNDPEDHSVYWINFYELAGFVEDIQVQRGGGSSLYGPPAIGGSINLVTQRNSSLPSVSLESGLGSYNTQRYSASLSSGLIAGKFSFNLKASKVTSDGYRDWSWSEFYRFFFNASYFDGRQSAVLTLFGGPQKDGLAFYGIPKADNEDETKRKANYGSRLKDREFLTSPQVSLVHDYKFSDNLILKNTLFFFSGDGYFDFDGTFGTTDYFRLPADIVIPDDLIMRAFVDNDQFGWIPQIEYKYSGGSLITGLEIRNHRSLHWGRIESGTFINLTTTGFPKERFYEYKGGKEIYSVFAHNRLQLSPDLLLYTGAHLIYQKYKIYDEKFVGTEFETPFTFLNPQIGALYNINEKTAIYSNFTYTKREPPLKNLYEAESASWGVEPQFEKNQDGTYNFNEPLVKPETMFNYEAGIRLKENTYRVSANLYIMDFIDEIVPSGGLDVFGQPRVGNAERTSHRGLEIEGALRLLKGLDFSANLNLSQNRFVKFTEYEGTEAFVRDNNYISNTPEIIANFQLSYVTSNYFVSLLVNHTGKQYTDNSVSTDAVADTEITVDPYTVASLSAGLNFKFNTISCYLSFEVNNLFNTKYLTTGFGRDNFFPAAERNMFVKLKLEY
ncbi:MAG: TonB-dependent receptor [Ignavibacteriaceae bacterium]|nr:TonB-dependent receptor [Ignavibacteriaceae bacterium]